MKITNELKSLSLELCIKCFTIIFGKIYFNERMKRISFLTNANHFKLVKIRAIRFAVLFDALSALWLWFRFWHFSDHECVTTNRSLSFDCAVHSSLSVNIIYSWWWLLVFDFVTLSLNVTVSLCGVWFLSLSLIQFAKCVHFMRSF